MLTKSEIKNALLLMLNRAGGQIAQPSNDLIAKLGAGYSDVVDDLVRQGRLKSNYTTTQGVTSALHYLQLTSLGRLDAEIAVASATSDTATGVLEAIKAAIDGASAKPVVLVFEDGSIARINSTSSEATIALFKAAIKQAST